MRKFATADCETDPFLHGRVPKPFIWGHYDGQEFNYFFETKDFVEFISKRKEIIYFHNGGKFDMHFLFDFLSPQSDIMVVNGRIAKIKLGDCELRDSFMLLPVPLSAYKKDEIDYTKFEKHTRKRHLDEIHTYLKTDCVYLYEILEKNFELYGQKISLASSAFDFWHKNFSGQEYKPKSCQGFFKFFKDYYFGGRVECFQKGLINFPFKMYDIRSAYPYAMLENHAFGTEYTVSTRLPDKNLELCFVHLRAQSRGALPVRGSGLGFPSDNEFREYFATGWEIKTGFETSTLKIDKIYRVTKFLNTISFKEYVSHFYKEKESYRDTDSARYLLAKLYLNSLYGKFGQNSNDHKNYELAEARFIEAKIEDGFSFENMIGIHALMSEPVNDKDKKFYNVATAASITGFVRAYLFKHILSADTPLYCDTDCIVSKNLPCDLGPEIGQWDLQGEYSHGAIAGKKLYAFIGEKGKEKISSKGVKLNAKEIFDVAQGQEILYKNDAPTFSIGKEASFLKRRVNMT
ncbi:MAG: DNA polymerase [Rhabdochlamydiaceae bacterium]